MTETRKYLTLRRAARELGVHQRTLRRWEKQGLIHLVRLPGSGHRRVPVEEVRRIQAGIASPQSRQRVRLVQPRRDPESQAQAQALAEAVCRELVGLESATTYDEFMTSRRGREWSP